MGKPGGGRTPSSRKGGELGELKHLSNPRKREDSASSGERKRSSPNRRTCSSGLQDPGSEVEAKWKRLGSRTGEGESPVHEGEAERGNPEYHGAR